MTLKLASYVAQQLAWPKTGNHILAQFDNTSIVVYQAFNEKIAQKIVECQNYHSEPCLKVGLSMNRMTWIKTNFLWMMYRAGWASKPNQERILAIRITRDGFEEILGKAVGSRKKVEEAPGAKKGPTKEDEVRLQWDPDHTPKGEKVESGRRAIQLGLRGDAFRKLSENYIVNITDITDFVKEQYQNIDDPEKLVVPEESVYPLGNKEIADNIKLDSLN